MIKPKCDLTACGKELKDFGGIVLSPPEEDGKVEKKHVCKDCWNFILSPFFKAAATITFIHEEVKGLYLIECEFIEEVNGENNYKLHVKLPIDSTTTAIIHSCRKYRKERPVIGYTKHPNYPCTFEFVWER